MAENSISSLESKASTVTSESVAGDKGTDEKNQQLSADSELDALLEDALQGFDKQFVGRQCCHEKQHATGIDAVSSSSASASTSSPAHRQQSDRSTSGSAPSTDDMESLLMSLMSGDISQHLAGLDVGPTATDGQTDFADTLQRTLGDLARSASDVQNSDLSDDDLLRIMSQLTADTSDADADLFPMMQGMMKNLLSKDVLYPSLKEISSQYPAWLSSNRDVISQQDYNRYESQHRLMTDIVQEFEIEQSTDSEDVKRRRFERILDAMQQMQSLGQPPKELIGELPHGLLLDEDGVPVVPTSLQSAEQCCVM